MTILQRLDSRKAILMLSVYSVSFVTTKAADKLMGTAAKIYKNYALLICVLYTLAIL